MRFASWMFVGVSVLTVASVVLVSFQHPGARGGADANRSRPHASMLVSGDENAVRRLRAKGAVTRRLIDGELTLLEAGAWFQYLDANFPSAASEAAPGEEGMSETERFCRQAIRWAETEAADESASRAEAVRRRLNAELTAAFQGGRSDDGPSPPGV